jgi:hypothetical protein
MAEALATAAALAAMKAVAEYGAERESMLLSEVATRQAAADAEQTERILLALTPAPTGTPRDPTCRDGLTPGTVCRWPNPTATPTPTPGPCGTETEPRTLCRWGVATAPPSPSIASTPSSDAIPPSSGSSSIGALTAAEVPPR